MRKTTTIPSTCIVLVLICGGFAVGDTNPYTIPQGSATVDGDASDWATADWIEGTLQAGYWTGADVPGNEDVNIPSTMFAARWQDDDPGSGTPGRIYAIAIVDQSELQLMDAFTEWCATDRIEWFVHGPNNLGDVYHGNFYDAQQYVMSPMASDPSQLWTMAGYKKGEPTSLGLDLEAAVNVSGSTITYEVSFPVYDSWEGFAHDGTTVIADLAPGAVVGFDLLVGSGIAPYPGGSYPEYGRFYYMLDETGIPASSVHKADGSSSNMLTYTLVPGPITCDFDKNGFCDIDDINAMTARGDLVAGVSAPDDPMDLTGDDTINTEDITEWLAQAGTSNGLSGPYLLGDANLDGLVNASDLNDLAINWQTTVSAWSQGDFNGSGFVDAPDLNGLAINWQQSTPVAAMPLPEPSSWILLPGAGLLFCCRRRRTSR